LVIDTWTRVTDEVKDEVADVLKKDKLNPLVQMSDSGARGSLDNFKQLMGMKGCVMNPKNEAIELPIVSSYREGMKVAEFFINTHGARKGGADTALKTADSGYLTRRLVDVAQDVVVREEDCHCDHGFKVREIRDTSRYRHCQTRRSALGPLLDARHRRSEDGRSHCPGEHDDVRRPGESRRQSGHQRSGNPLLIHLPDEEWRLPALLWPQHGDRPLGSKSVKRLASWPRSPSANRALS
jgi:hypothetical protein